MKIVVAGSRDIELYEVVREAIITSGITDITEIVSGRARGPDKLGEEYAKEFGLGVKIFKPDYDRFPKDAPFIRNAQMASYCDAGVIIWDTESNGTRHMMKCMERENKPFHLVKVTLSYKMLSDGQLVRVYQIDRKVYVEYTDGKYVMKDFT